MLSREVDVNRRLSGFFERRVITFRFVEVLAVVIILLLIYAIYAAGRLKATYDISERLSGLEVKVTGLDSSLQAKTKNLAADVNTKLDVLAVGTRYPQKPTPAEQWIVNNFVDVKKRLRVLEEARFAAEK